MAMITEIQVKMLKALAKYKYLTVSQMVDLDISPSIDTIRKYCNVLKKEELVKQTGYRGTIQEAGRNKNIRYEGMIFLAKSGVDFLEGLGLENIKYPKNYKIAFANDYIHRSCMISTCISFDKYLQKNELNGFTKIDFHNAETTIEISPKLTVKPDIIIGFNQNIFILEVWAGLEKEYILSQLQRLTKGLASKKISEFLEYDRLPRVVNIFRDVPTMERVKKELQAELFFESAVNKGLFYFATFENIKQDFSIWQDINGKNVEVATF
jgi:hypothetical protein